jgi:glutamate-ammonia-ligase adenylyltransferase
LRPSGNKGPVAIRFSGFVEYQETEAWTWEHMALTRTRVVASDDDFAARIRASIRTTLMRKRDPQALLRDVAEMREQMWETNGKTAPLAIKHRIGGMVDIEFIAQYLLLKHANTVPDAIGADTGTALRLLGEAGVLAHDHASQLGRTHALWRRVQHLLRLIGHSAPKAADMSVALKRRIAEAAGRLDFDEAQQDIESHAKATRALYDQMIALPAAQLPPAPPSDKEKT